MHDFGSNLLDFAGEEVLASCDNDVIHLFFPSSVLYIAYFSTPG